VKNQIENPTKLSVEDLKKSPLKFEGLNRDHGINSEGLKNSTLTDDNSNSKDFYVNVKKYFDIKNPTKYLKSLKNKHEQIDKDSNTSSKILTIASPMMIHKEN
jgi:hypothetical protein